jgi:MATE family multidrug resistance protein
MPLSPRHARLRAEAGATFVLALPLVVGQVLTILMNVVDTMLAGRLGTRVLAAVAMGYQVWVLVILVVIGVMMAVPPSVAQLDGAGRRDEVGALYRQSLWLALALGTVLLLGVRFGGAWLLEVAGVAPAIVPDALAFLNAIAWGAPALALFFAAKGFSEGLLLTRPAMYFSALGLVLLAPLAWALMYGRLGLPAFGAEGAGIAHAAVLWVEALAFMVYVGRRRHYAALRPYARFDPPGLAALGGLLRLGVPMGVSIFMEGSLFVATALLVGSLGEVPAAAHQIAINVASVAFMLPLGIAMATTVRVGNAVGRRDVEGVAWAVRAAMVLVLATQVFSLVLMLGFGRPIARAYTDDEAVIGMATALLLLAGVFQLPDGVQALYNGALRGLKDTLLPAIITTLSYWGVGLSGAVWIGLVRDGGPQGFWIGLIMGLSAAALLLGWRYTRLSRRLRAAGIPAELAEAARADPI